jgi:molybdate transport system substrate-binding protein
MKKSWLLLLLVVLAVTVVVPAQASAATTLKVFAAASLNKAFPAEARAFKVAYPKYKTVKFSFQFLGTDVLVAQLLNDPAAADVFAGASTAYGDTLAGHTPDPIIRPYTEFCQNRLCVILPKQNFAGITTLADVAAKSTQIAVGQASVPIGKYTDKVLTNITADPAYPGFKTTVQSKAVYVQNVASIDGVVAFGGADAGFVYDSDYKQLAIPYGVTRILIPNGYQTDPLPTYPLARTIHARYPALAQKFVNFILSRPGQRILKSWGFLPKPAVTP